MYDVSIQSAVSQSWQTFAQTLKLWSNWVVPFLWGNQVDSLTDLNCESECSRPQVTCLRPALVSSCLPLWAEVPFTLLSPCCSFEVGCQFWVLWLLGFKENLYTWMLYLNVLCCTAGWCFSLRQFIGEMRECLCVCALLLLWWLRDVAGVCLILEALYHISNLPRIVSLCLITQGARPAGYVRDRFIWCLHTRKPLTLCVKKYKWSQHWLVHVFLAEVKDLHVSYVCNNCGSNLAYVMLTSMWCCIFADNIVFRLLTPGKYLFLFEIWCTLL